MVHTSYDITVVTIFLRIVIKKLFQNQMLIIDIEDLFCMEYIYHNYNVSPVGLYFDKQSIITSIKYITQHA